MRRQLASPLGVCVLPSRPRNTARTVVYGHYLYEILDHAGLCYARLSVDELAEALSSLRILVTVGDIPFPDSLRDALTQWVGLGGAWLAIGGTAGMPALFGVEEESASYAGWGANIGTLGEGYLRVQSAQHPVLEHMPIPLHFFNGVPVRNGDAQMLADVLDAHQRETNRAGVVWRQVGNGRCLLIAPDVTGTVVRIQQGIAVTRDGISAPDGTASIGDEMLKSSDGAVLDWWFDRQPVPGVPGLSAFLHPIADIWREMVIRAVLYLAHTQDVLLPILWLYPRNLPAIAHLSHDTDVNEPAKAKQMLQLLQQAGVRSTWCVILPGYPAEVIACIVDAGHELAMHYDAVEEGSIWNEGAFHEQWRQLRWLFGGKRIITNKNHYLRWEGDTDFYEWCQRLGIRLDQSKGPSKTGEAGFVFGTCHPYFPVDPKGRVIDVLELPTLTQDLNVFAPDALLEPLLQAVLRHHGVLHVLFHPAHVDKPRIAETILQTVQRAQENGMEWWTACRIDEWERTRRMLVWREYIARVGDVSIRLEARQPLEEATLLFVGRHEGAVEVNGQAIPLQPCVRWGMPVGAVTLNLQGDMNLRVVW